MAKSGRVWQWYGYTAVITGLVDVMGLIDHALRLAKPLPGELRRTSAADSA